jgi:lipooligosaccharide transport system permease protein
VSAAQSATPLRERSRLAAIREAAPHPTRWRHIVGYMLAVYRREWQGSVFSGFIEPIVVLAGLGIGLGVLVGEKAAEITGGVSYVAYIAPALMVSSAMNLATSEAAWPILARVAWVRIYHAIIATPLNAADVMVGAIAFIVGKVAFAAAFFAGVLLITGITTSPEGALGMLAVSILTAFAFGAPMAAFSVTQKSDQGFAFLFRLIITPLTFFSGTYFPIENLPFAAQVLSWCTPLAHGVALSRALALGTPLTNLGIHVAALLLWGIVGTIAAIYLFRKRMLK